MNFVVCVLGRYRLWRQLLKRKSIRVAKESSLMTLHLNVVSELKMCNNCLKYNLFHCGSVRKLVGSWAK